MANKDAPRAWLRRTCPECGSPRNFACRDEDGYLSNPHDTRVIPPAETEASGREGERE